MAAPVTLHAVAGGDHSLAVRRRTAPEIYDVIGDWMRAVAGQTSDISRL
jgi:hypothetical protein